MTCNNVILAQPQAQGSVSYTVPEGDSARLNFGPEEISGIRLGDSGQLIISFANGGELTITNFQELINSDSLLYLADGTLVDPSMLTGSLQSPDVLAAQMPQADLITITQPAKNTKQEISLAEGQKYICDFDPANMALVAVIDGKMVLTFADGSQVILNNYSDMMAGDLPPEITLADGTVVDGSELLTEVVDVTNIEPAAGDEELEEIVGEEDMAALAQQLAEVQPAAGEAVGKSNSGYGFNSIPSSDPLGSLDAAGPLNPTQLQYNAPQVSGDNGLLQTDDRPIIGPSVKTIDETALSGGNIVVTGLMNVNYGNDTPGTITPNGITSISGSLPGGVLSSGGVPVIVTSTAGGYVGTADGVTVFIMDVTKAGAYTYTQILPFDHADGTNDNDIVTINFGVVATDADGDKISSTIRINVADDAPVILSQVDISVDESDYNAGKIYIAGQFQAEVGQDAPFMAYSLNNNFIASGSVNNNLSSGGFPVTVSVNDGRYVGVANGETVFVLQLNYTTGEYSYTQFKSLDHADANDANDLITLQFGVDILDSDGDTADGFITINVFDDGTSLENSTENTTITTTGDIGTNAGITIIDTTLSPTAVTPEPPFTSGGVPIVISTAGNNVVGTAGGITVFEIEILANGTYVYTQTGPIDQQGNDAPVVINTSVNVEDSNGNITIQTLSIDVNDETTQTGVIEVGPGVSVVGIDIIDTNVDNTLTSNGVPVIVTLDGNTYVGTANGVIIFDIQILDDGSYNFNQYEELDQGDVTNPLTLNIDVEVEDDNGNVTTQSIVISVDNNFPDLSSNANIVAEDPLDAGSVTLNSIIDFGGDGPGAVDPTGEFRASGSVTDWELTSNGNSVAVTLEGNKYIGVANGVEIFTLEINPANGEYTFVLNHSLDHADGSDPQDLIELQFGMLVSDSEGDNVEGFISIFIQDGVPVIHDSTGSVDEDNLSSDPVVETGTVSPNYNADGAGSVTTTGSFAASGSLDNGVLSHNGVAINVTSTSHGYVGIAGALTIFTLDIDPLTGEYTFTQFESLDHADNNDANDVITLTFGAEVTDYDGDTDTSNIVINVVDSMVAFQSGGPEIDNGLETVDESNLSVGPFVETGKLNADFGGDNPGSYIGIPSQIPTGLIHAGIPVSVTFEATSNSFTGMADGTAVFTLVINRETGDYTYTQLVPLDHPDGTDHNDALTLEFGVFALDSEGEGVEGSIVINVLDDGLEAVNDAKSIREGITLDGNVLNNDNIGADGLDTITQVTVNDVTTLMPATGSLVLEGRYGTLTINDNGNYIYVPYNNDPEGVDHFTYTIRDNDGDTSRATLSIDVSPDYDPIVLGTENKFDETNLHGEGSQTLYGSLNVGYRGEGPGVTTGNGDFNFTGTTALTSGGHPVTVTLTPTGYYLGEANGETVFYVEISSDGHYNFTLLKPIDHPNSSDPNDSIHLEFGIVATDMDGDSTDGTLTITVNDDGPVVLAQGARTLDESFSEINYGGHGVVSGQFNADVGQDVVGNAFAANNTFIASGSIANNVLSSKGVPVAVTNGGDNVYTGSANGVVVFTLTLNTETGNYTYRQYQPFDHAITTNPNDQITLQFGVEVTDFDGDQADGFITINVLDDGPVAVDDSASLSRTTNSASGNVLANDDFGVDAPASKEISYIEWDGGDVRAVGVPHPDGSFSVNGNYGTLTMKADGSYTYVRSGRAGGVDNFNYNIIDGDGDRSQATLTVSVGANHSPISISGSGATDDSALSTGPDVETGTININTQGDGFGATTGNGNFSSGGSQLGGALSHNGVPVNVSFNAGTNTYTGTSGSVTVFTMVINTNGTYTFCQFENLDHGNNSNNDEALTLSFGVRATDSDGDQGHGIVTISVRDDGPDAVNDSFSPNATPYAGRTFNLNVLANDHFSQDEIHIISNATFKNGTAFTLDNYSDYVNYANYGGPTHTTACLDKSQFIILMEQQINNGGEFKGLASIPSGAYALFNYGDELVVLTVATKWHVVSDLQVEYTLMDGDGDISTAVANSRTYHTPLVLDLDGDGVELINVDQGVKFDMDNDGDLEQTGWVSSDDAFLVLDKNQDGGINDRSEMFGSTDDYEDGFANLESYDSNNDGVIDASDDIFENLQIWQDFDTDGISDAGELLSLSEAGILSISLNTTTPNELYIEGNWISHISSYDTVDGQTHDIVDAWFDTTEIMEENVIIADTINESSDVIFYLNSSDESETDLSLLLETSDDVTNTIHDFVYSQTGDDVIDETVVADQGVGQLPLAETSLDNNIVDSDIIL